MAKAVRQMPCPSGTSFLFSMYLACAVSGISDGFPFLSAPRYLSTINCRLARVHPVAGETSAAVSARTDTVLKNKATRAIDRIIRPSPGYAVQEDHIGHSSLNGL